MVKRVYGTADNISLTFEREAATGLWQAAVPSDADGEYVVALYAEDEAGNTAYMATILYTADIRNLCVSIRVLEYAADVDTAIVDAVLYGDTSVSGGIRECLLSASLSNVELAVVRCELCGR